MKRFQFLICLGIFVSNLKCLFITNFPFHSVHICIDSAIAPLSLKFIIKFDCNITHQLLSNLIFVFDDALFNGFIFKIITVKQKIKMYNPTKGSFFDKVIHQKNSFCLSGLKKWNQFSNSNHVFYVNLRREHIQQNCFFYRYMMIMITFRGIEKQFKILSYSVKGP